MKMWAESKDTDRDERIKNIRELVRGVISKFDTLPDFLEQAALMTADDERDTGAPSVSIMTMHAAKGLEFDTVFLPAWEDGTFPNDLAISDDGLEEERRLAYVAITRAKRRCLIICSACRMMFGQFQRNPPSRFLAEIDESFLDSPKAVRNTPPPKREPEKREIGKIITHPRFGFGVVIETCKESITVAFKTCIKKLPKD
jgi:DNA helicase-2/ATP-dependent DNA helicase PcrA